MLAISRVFGDIKKTIRNLPCRFRQTGSLRDRPWGSRSRLITHGRTGTSRWRICAVGFLPATATARGYGTTPQAVWNRLKSRNRPIRAYMPYYGQILTRAVAVILGSDAQNTDESRLNISDVGACVLQRSRFGGGRVVVCGGVLGSLKTVKVFWSLIPKFYSNLKKKKKWPLWYVYIIFRELANQIKWFFSMTLNPIL